MNAATLGWLGILRLGLVQTALGAIVVMSTSTLNRVMVIEYALPATVPGLLVGLHYAVQVLRPRWGYGSDKGGRHTPWILGGIGTLAAGGFGAALAVVLLPISMAAGLALAVLSYLLIGVGVGAAGTNLLVLLAKRVAPERRGPAATLVWVMMIMGFIVTTAIAGHNLDPFSPARLLVVTGIISVIATLLAFVALARIEGRTTAPPAAAVQGGERSEATFRDALREVWSEPHSRRFTIFVFVSMLAYSSQDLILEPFAGIVFALTPGQTTKLSSLQHGGVLMGMVMVALLVNPTTKGRFGSLRSWTIAGCIASAAALALVAIGGLVGPSWPLRTTVFALGVANGAYAVAAIGSMMGMMGEGGANRGGTRMGLWGAAQAIAFGIGGLAGSTASDIARVLMGAAIPAYALVFMLESVLFLVSAVLAAGLTRAPEPAPGKLVAAE
jgi:BCD family chlorophyll transporter-like MFS transporter